MRKEISLLCALALIVSFTTGVAFASDTNFSSAKLTMFNDVCNAFFENPDTHFALDKNGEDISSSFRSKYYPLYLEKDYKALFTAFENELSRFKWINPEDQSVKRSNTNSRLLMTYTTSESYYETGATSQHLAGTTFEVFYTIHGTYIVNDGSSEIIDAEATLAPSFTTPGVLYSLEATNISTSAKINSTKRQVTFSAKFDVNVSLMEHYLGAVLWTETVGKFGNSYIRTT